MIRIGKLEASNGKAQYQDRSYKVFEVRGKIQWCGEQKWG